MEVCLVLGEWDAPSWGQARVFCYQTNSVLNFAKINRNPFCVYLFSQR